MKTLVFLLEGPSEKEMLQGLLPRILPSEIQTRFIIFQGKQDLEKNLVLRVRHWKSPDSVFIILRDQDAGNCLDIKAGLKNLCDQTKKARRAGARPAPTDS